MSRIVHVSRSSVGRREVIKAGASLAATAALSPSSRATSDPLAKLWVRYITGGHPYRPSYPAMFLDPLFVEMEIGPNDLPSNFASTLIPNAGPARTPATGGVKLARLRPVDPRGAPAETDLPSSRRTILPTCLGNRAPSSTRVFARSCPGKLRCSASFF
jgi:hypothetical protein